MQIEKGKYYRTRGGEKVGPMRPESGDWSIDDGSGRLWSDNGKRWSRRNSYNDIVSEWVDEPTAEPKFKVGDLVIQDNGYDCQDLVEHWNKYWANHNGKYNGYFYVTALDYVDGINYSANKNGNGPWVPQGAMKHYTPAIVARVENGQPKPSMLPVVHNTEDDAKREAYRLAANNKGKEFAVFTQTYSAKQEKTYDHEWQRLAARGDKIRAVDELKRFGVNHMAAKHAIGCFMKEIN